MVMREAVVGGAKVDAAKVVAGGGLVPVRDQHGCTHLMTSHAGATFRIRLQHD